MKENSSIIEAFDFVILGTVLFLIAIGVAFIYSSGINSDGILVTKEYIKQIVWGGIGLVFLIAFALYDYRKFERPAYWFFLALIIVLVYTKLFGRYVNGARSWLGLGDFGIQPSEFGKVIFIVTLAKYLDGSKNENPLKRLFISSLIFLVPVGLILIQPDMGTASVYIPIFFIICFMAGIPIRYLAFLLFSGVSMILFTVLPVWNEYIVHGASSFVNVLSNMKLKLFLIIATFSIALISMLVRRYLNGKKYYYWIAYGFLIFSLGLAFSTFAGKVLKDYQIKRLIVFMDPTVDPLGSGWNIIQSKIAIGSGGLSGRSFLHGTQSHYRFLPQQSTDFIFSILSEELGFFGGAFIFFLYSVLMFRTLHIIKKCNIEFGIYIASGILAILFIHFFINVGMVMGIMPITGIPLLFMSYGGSSLITAMTCMGLLMSISYRKFDFL